eukprot:GDKI01036467.1.p1 GENE.GDKI01036467.1~~GDKI01036467.1.p1  ORF type:complete len:235 (+),score=38.12 GDKI01036467.1:34-705(+)
MSVVLPGDTVEELEGVAYTAGRVLLAPVHPHKPVLMNLQKKYTPKAGDLVIGIVTQKTVDFFKLDINGPTEAILQGTSFERATKRNKPNLNIGSVVYCMVIGDMRDFECEVSCISVDDKKGWTTNETYLGELKGPYSTLLETPLAHASCLQSEESFVLSKLGESLPYEVVVGANGRVFVNSSCAQHTIVIANCIKNSARLTLPQVDVMVKKFIAMYAGQTNTA